jgi:hypothetical protein
MLRSRQEVIARAPDGYRAIAWSGVEASTAAERW